MFELRKSAKVLISRITVIPNYLTGKKYSVELMCANFATAKIVKDLNQLKIYSDMC